MNWFLIKKWSFIYRLALFFQLVFLFMPLEAKEVWEDKEKIVLKIGDEWVNLYKIKKEVEYCKDIFNEIEILKKYPKKMSDFDEKVKGNSFKKILEIQKLLERIIENINKNSSAIVDALDIMREMITSEPIEKMFIAISKESDKRQRDIKIIEPLLDTLWLNLNNILSYFLITFEEDNKKILTNKYAFNELLTIDNKEQRYKKLIEKSWMVKRLLIKKASDDIRKEIEKIEKEQIRNYIANNRFYIAKIKIDYIIDELSEYIVLSEYYLLLTKILFLEKSYNEAIIFTNKIEAEKDSIKWLSLAYKFQSLFALKEYQKILSEVSNIDIKNIKGKVKNILLWIIFESAKATNRIGEFLYLEEIIEKNSPYSLYALYSAVQCHLILKEDSIALLLLLRGSREKPLTEYDRKAEEEIKIAIPLLYYEKGEYEKALTHFYTLINHKNLFLRALLGIAFCNFKMERYDKAEEALRKIINLDPQNIIAAESLMMLALRYIQKAKLAWNKYCYVNREKGRLTETLKKIDSIKTISFNIVDTQKINKAKEEIQSTLKLLESEKVIEPPKISSYYKKAQQIYKFLVLHYQTGSFQEVNFTESRERVLNVVDSVKRELLPVKDENIVEIDKLHKIKVKEMVNKAKLCEVISLIDQYRWEKEYVEWNKDILNKQSKNIKDSINKNENRFTIKDKILDSLLKIEDSITISYLYLLEEKIKYLFTLSLDTIDLCYLKYQLGEFYYNYENIEYNRKCEEYERLFKQRNLDSLGKDNLILPKIDHQRSISILKEAISIAPNTIFGGAARYCLAWCYNDLELLDSAYYQMKFITENFPQHPYSPQAWMFCGEYHFEKGNLNEALLCYQKVLTYSESEWFDDALYKIAWTQYRLSNPDKAISAFLTLIDVGNKKGGQSLLEKESIDYIAISFSEIDISGEKGLSRAVAFAKRFGDVRRSCQILHRLAQIYRTQGRYGMAKKTYELLLSQYPKYEKNYLVEAELIALSDRQKDKEFSTDARALYFKKYNRNSEWALHQEDTIRKAADSVAQKMLYEAAIGYHQFALQKDRKDIYSKAIEAYSNYIKTYKTSLTNECHYNLAEIHFSLGNYKEAALEYMSVSRDYPDSKYKETAAWNAIVAAQMLYKKENLNEKKENNIK